MDHAVAVTAEEAKSFTAAWAHSIEFITGDAVHEVVWRYRS